MNRWRLVKERYGSRTLFVVLAMILKRADIMRQILFLSWLRLTTSGTKGRRIVLGKNINVTPGGVFDLSDGVSIGDRCVFEIGLSPKAQVTIGVNAWISHDCHLSASSSICIGEQVLIGEFVSLRDSTHDHSDRELLIKEQKDIIGELIIEENVWIGRGCLIQGRPGGVVVGRGSIIAANSVVSRSIPPMEIWGGAPASFIKSR